MRLNNAILIKGNKKINEKLLEKKKE